MKLKLWSKIEIKCSYRARTISLILGEFKSGVEIYGRQDISIQAVCGWEADVRRFVILVFTLKST